MAYRYPTLRSVVGFASFLTSGGVSNSRASSEACSSNIGFAEESYIITSAVPSIPIITHPEFYRKVKNRWLFPLILHLAI